MLNDQNCYSIRYLFQTHINNGFQPTVSYANLQGVKASMVDFENKADLIWEVANLLRGDYRQSDYGKVILPMTVLRRLDCVLAPSKQKVLNYLPKVEKLSDSAKDVTLNKVAKLNFHIPRKTVQTDTNLIVDELFKRFRKSENELGTVFNTS